MRFVCTKGRKKNKVRIVYPRVESFRKREYLALEKQTRSILLESHNVYVRFVRATDGRCQFEYNIIMCGLHTKRVLYQSKRTLHVIGNLLFSPVSRDSHRRIVVLY